MSEIEANYIEIFREEAREILCRIEDSLLELEEHPEAEAFISEIFRGLHTLKGSGPMAGFDDLAALAHELENVFDHVRSGKAKATRELVAITLSAIDVMKKMIFGDLKSGMPVYESMMTEIREAAAELLPGHKGSRKAEPVCSADRIPDPEKEHGIYEITFHPPKDIFARGTDPAIFLDGLRSLGQCKVTGFLDSIPDLEDLDPESCYMSWEVLLFTDKGIDDIKDIFIFVENGSRIDIKEMCGSPLLSSLHPENKTEPNESSAAMKYTTPNNLEEKA